MTCEHKDEFKTQVVRALAVSNTTFISRCAALENEVRDLRSERDFWRDTAKALLNEEKTAGILRALEHRERQLVAAIEGLQHA